MAAAASLHTACPHAFAAAASPLTKPELSLQTAADSMGKSMRRHKRHKPRIVKRQKKKPHVKSSVPRELVVNAAEITERVGIE